MTSRHSQPSSPASTAVTGHTLRMSGVGDFGGGGVSFNRRCLIFLVAVGGFVLGHLYLQGTTTPGAANPATATAAAAAVASLREANETAATATFANANNASSLDGDDDDEKNDDAAALLPCERQKDEVNDDPRICAYEVAIKRAGQRLASVASEIQLVESLQEHAKYRNNTKTKTENNGATYYAINLIRIPKAGSSTLSTVARALAGCGPNNGMPCGGRYAELCDSFVLGCEGHHVEYPEDDAGTSSALATITTVREPSSRLLSAFFYNGKQNISQHRPWPVDDCSWEMFRDRYLMDTKYRNIMTKMLNGYFPYLPYHDDTDETTSDRSDDQWVHPAIKTEMNLMGNSSLALDPSSVGKAKRRLCNMAFVGLTYNMLGSMLLMYETAPFDALQPRPVAFGLPPHYKQTPSERQQREIVKKKGDLKVNANEGNELYETFKEVTYIENGGPELVAKYNAYDVEVYQFAVDLFCARARESTLFNSGSPFILELFSKDCGDMKSGRNNSANMPTTDQLCSSDFF